MTLQQGNPEVKFKPRPLEGIQPSISHRPELMLLDGQQRLTSLYLSLYSSDPVPTRNAKGNEIHRHYFASIDKCIDDNADREDEGIISVPADGFVRADFGRQVILDLSTTEGQIHAGHFPLSVVLDSDSTMDWFLQFMEQGPGTHEELRDKWKRFKVAVIEPFTKYLVPAIQLDKSTPKEAVCQVFEKVNTGGVSLTVFELLTATYAADDFNLREDWETRRNKFQDFSVLRQFSATDFLQVTTLLATWSAHTDHVGKGEEGDRVPAISCKRRDILRLALKDYIEWADVAVEAVLRAARFLHSEYVFSDRHLPYNTQLVPLAAILAALGHEDDGWQTSNKLRRWYWCGVFGEMYGRSTETRFALDLHDVVAWIGNEGPLPRTISDAQFQADRLYTLQNRNSAAYKGLFALQMQGLAADFRTGKRIDVHVYVDDRIDIHHIFPRAWCVKHAIDRRRYNCVVNKTAISARTNRIIGGNAPSKYLAELEASGAVNGQNLDAALISHGIDPAALRADDFQRFFDSRFEKLIFQIEEVMGKEANRTSTDSD